MFQPETMFVYLGRVPHQPAFGRLNITNRLYRHVSKWILFSSLCLSQFFPIWHFAAVWIQGADTKLIRQSGGLGSVFGFTSWWIMSGGNTASSTIFCRPNICAAKNSLRGLTGAGMATSARAAKKSACPSVSSNYLWRRNLLGIL